MNESTELKNLILQWYERMSSGDILGSAERIISRQDGVLDIGSDPTEWLEGFESIIQVFKEMANMGTFEIKAGDLKAYSEGTIGWAADRPTMKMPNGTEVSMRHTFVFHKEDGEWKLVQGHASIGVPNEEIGYEAG